MLDRLAALYRRTGADLPFGDPRRAHGVAMEGYFWRFTDRDRARAVIALCGICRARDGTWALVALAAHPGGFERWAIAPAAHADDRALRVDAGEALQADAAGVRVDLGPGARLDARLTAVAGWPRRAFGALGPAHVLPGLGQYWHPHVLRAGVSGTAELGDGVESLDGATAYAEKNWGARFAQRWWWGEAHDFPGAPMTVAFAGGDVATRPRPLAATAVVVCLDGRAIRLVAPLARVRADMQPGRWALQARAPRWSVDVEGDPHGTAPHVLPVPVPAERRAQPGSHQHLAGRIAVTVRHRGRVVATGESPLAGLEREAGAHGGP